MLTRYCGLSLAALLTLNGSPTLNASAAAAGPPARSGAAAAISLRPELDLKLGHSAPVAAVAFSPDGQILASGSFDDTVKLWDVPAHAWRRTLTGHTGPVLAVGFSPDGETLASGSADKTVRLWDVRTGTYLRPLAGHQDAVKCVAFSPDGKTLASGSMDHTIKLWDLPAHALRRTLSGHEGSVLSIAFSPDGTLLASGSADHTVRLWDTHTGAALRTFVGANSLVTSVAFLPGGKTLAAGSLDNQVRLWDVGTGALLRTLAGHGVPAVLSVAFSPDGKSLASAGADCTRLWDLETGVGTRELHVSHGLVLSVAFSPDGRTLASGGGDNLVRLWDAQTGQPEQTLGSLNPVSSVVFSPDGRTLASGGADNMVRLWDARTGALRRALAGHQGPVSALAFSPDGKMLASASDDATVRLWNPRTGALLRSLSRDKIAVTSIAFSPDGKTLAGGSFAGTVRLWDTQTGALLPVRMEPGGPLLSAIHPAIAFSPDGTTLASGSSDRRVRLWDVKTGTLVRSLTGSTDEIRSVAFAPDGRTLASGSDDGAVRLWDAQTGAVKSVLTGHQTMVTSVAFSPDGTTLASGSLDGTVRVWNAQTGAPLETLPGNSVFSVAFSPDGRVLASGSSDGTVRVWDRSAWRLLATLFGLPPTDPGTISGISAKPITAAAKDLPAPDGYLALTPEGYYASSPAADRFVYFRLGRETFPAECFQARCYRPDLVKHALAGQPLPPVGEFKGPYPPTAVFLSPQSGDSIAGGRVRVTLETMDDSDIRSVEWLINGARVDAKPLAGAARPITAMAKGISAADGPVPAAYQVSRQFSALLPLPPGDAAIHVQAIAIDNDGLQSPRQEILLSRANGPDSVHELLARLPSPRGAISGSRDPAAIVEGKLLGLCVGVSRYRDASLDLSYADQDATALAAALNRQGGIYQAARVTALTNEQATCARVLRGLDRLAEEATRTDTVVVFLSGHGWRRDERSFYFATYEVDRNNVAGTALPWTALVQRLIKLSEKSKRVLVLLDACHSGSAVDNDELVQDVLHANAGVMVLASSKGQEVSLESAELRHGDFTEALLEATAGRAVRAGEPSTTVRQFVAYVARRVIELTNESQHPCLPLLVDFDPDAAIVRRPSVPADRKIAAARRTVP